MAANPMPTGEVFGDLLRERRVVAGLTQEELAERAGLSVRGISDLERGARARPHRDTLLRLADALAIQGAARAAFVGAARQAPGGCPARQNHRGNGTGNAGAVAVTSRFAVRARRGARAARRTAARGGLAAGHATGPGGAERRGSLWPLPPRPRTLSRTVSSSSISPRSRRRMRISSCRRSPPASTSTNSWASPCPRRWPAVSPASGS